MTYERIAEAVALGVDGIVCKSSNTIDKKIIDLAGQQLKVIATLSVGYDHIDLEYAKQCGVQVGHTPDVLTDATADLTVALTLAICRRLGEAIDAVRNGTWTTWDPTWLLGMELRGKTLGILGMGRIGLATAKRLKAFGMNRVIYYNRSSSSYAAEVDGELVSFEQLLKQSDILCICCSLTESTKHMLGYEQFCQMKSTSIVVNTARGGIIEQDGLVRALEEKKIGAAGLDVTTPEPLSPSHPLLSLKNCIVLPHIGSATVETRNEMAILTVENLCAGVSGSPVIRGL
ncbi:glyoxylate reductase [Syncephalis fuscata]|nr:glyoxylate reductase [Syncephalis fuscata]